jgi:hypothetical protein
MLALTVLPSAEAAFNSPRPYEATFGYLPGLGGSRITMVSGQMDAGVAEGDGTWGFFATEGAEITGLTRVCWTATIRQCADSAAGALSIRVLPGGSFGVQFPAAAGATLTANHALAMFVDLGETGDLNSLQLGKSLLAPAVGGEVDFTTIADIPSSVILDPTSQNGGALAATDSGTVVEVRDGGAQRASLTGKVDPVTFAGRPAIAPIEADLVVIPFEGREATAHFETADRDDAVVGLDIARMNRLMGLLYSANQDEATQADEVDEGAFGPYQDAVAALFGGAVISLPTDGNSSQASQELAFARTTRLDVDGTSSGGLEWSGQATLDVRDGHVEGAQPLLGFGFFALPWWGWLLWIAALTVWIVRLVRKPDKTHPTWDRYKWIGWVASPLAFLLVFFLWDLELRAVFGLSVLSGTASGQVLLFVALLQIATFGLLSFAAIAPLRILLRNTSLLLHQGTFMGLAGAVASIVGFLIGAWTMLLSSLELILSQVMARLA